MVEQEWKQLFVGAEQMYGEEGADQRPRRSNKTTMFPGAPILEAIIAVASRSEVVITRSLRRGFLAIAAASALSNKLLPVPAPPVTMR